MVSIVVADVAVVAGIGIVAADEYDNDEDDDNVDGNSSVSMMLLHF